MTGLKKSNLVSQIVWFSIPVYLYILDCNEVHFHPANIQYILRWHYNYGWRNQTFAWLNSTRWFSQTMGIINLPVLHNSLFSSIVDPGRIRAHQKYTEAQESSIDTASMEPPTRAQRVGPSGIENPFLYWQSYADTRMCRFL